MSTPAEPPPSYEEASSSPAAPKTRNGIPPQSRRSMEDEMRPLPAGWIRSYDGEQNHQFFVDTKADPPRAIWQHPYDDDDFLKTLTSEERERIEDQSLKGLLRVPTKRDIQAESSGDDHSHLGEDERQGSKASHGLPTRPDEKPGKLGKFGRRLKDKITDSTHEEREAARRVREEEERQAYIRHQQYRQAMSRAAETGEPQFIGTDKNGKDVYIGPPQQGYGGGGGGYGGYGGYGGGYGGYGGGGYSSQPTYSNLPPNSRVIRPNYPYSRPYGYGYGGGLGLPIGAGLLGGALLGGLLF